MSSPKNRRNIIRIIPFGIIWLVFSIVYTLLERGLMGNLNYYPATGIHYDYAKNMFTTPLSALTTGLLIGVLETFCFSKWFRKKSFSKKILYKSLIYLVIILLFLFIVLLITRDSISIADTPKDFWSHALIFFTGYPIVSVMIFITSIIVVNQFYVEVSESIGHGALLNFFTGKYHQPVEEERIFMFLDMKSSTTIAEELGHVKYFEMLKEYFSDLSDSVINYAGEIYQYAGDEMIVSWKLKDGLKNNNCLHCFFAMKEAMKAQSPKYIARFKRLPQFKAGFHCGKVTTGEIGVLKKEIIFTGDVLNTTARIQGLCNQYNVDIIVSGRLAKTLDLYPTFQTASLGENKLRNRDETIALFTVLPIAAENRPS